jgi:hypothetical protein
VGGREKTIHSIVARAPEFLEKTCNTGIASSQTSSTSRAFEIAIERKLRDGFTERCAEVK